jgi:hypothetical protein
VEHAERDRNAQLSPQPLRRTQGTLATEAGVSAVAVAAHLGHDLAVTMRSYVDPNAVRAAQTERALRVIAGGRK